MRLGLGQALREIAIAEFEEMRAKRGPRPRGKTREKIRGYCDLCGEAGDNLIRDHDHKTGLMRGLVHVKCNAQISSWRKDTIDRLATYLDKPQGERYE